MYSLVCLLIMHLSEDITCVCIRTCMHYVLQRQSESVFCTFAVKRSWLGISQPELLCSSSCVSCVPKAVSLHNVCLFDISEHCCLLPREVSSLWCLTQWPWGQTAIFGWRPTCDTEIHMHTLSCGIKLTLHVCPAARWERLHVCRRLTPFIKSNVYSMRCIRVHS